MKNRKPEFDELCKLDNRLKVLEHYVLAIVANRSPHRLDTWYNLIKPRVCNLVGWDRRTGDPRLRTPESYDIVYEHLCETLTNYKYRRLVEREQAKAAD